MRWIDNSSFYIGTALITGCVVMAVEITASRLLAPYFGTSLLVWSNIIGVVLASLALGYYLGGVAADKHPKLQLLLSLQLVAGLIFLLTPFLIGPLVSGLLAFSKSFQLSFHILSSLLAALILFAAPLILLGMASPFLIKIYSLGKQSIGNIAGTISAVSTVGSIAGIFLPTLLFIPTYGTKKTIFFFAILLIVWSLIGLFGSRKALISLPIVILVSLQVPFGADCKVLYCTESSYQSIRVVEFGNLKYLALNEGAGVQSFQRKGSLLTQAYYDYYNLLPLMIEGEQPKKVLILGLAGGTMVGQLKYFFGDKVEITGVEVDSKIIDVSKRYFDLNDSKLKIINQDASAFLDLDQEQYDVIIVDAYENEFVIPWTLTTKEFFGKIRSRLVSDGIVAMNVAAPEGDNSLAEMIANTQASVFSHTKVSLISDDDWRSYIVASSDKDFSYDKLPTTDPELIKLSGQNISRTENVNFNISKPVLTDDLAPIDYLSSKLFIKHFDE